MQIRRARHESAEAALEDDQVLPGHVQFRPERVPGAAGRECLDEAGTTFRCEEMLKINRPGADRLRIRRVLRIDHSPACGAKGGADAVDIGNDCTGHRHFRNLAGGHEAVLQIDDDVRGLARVQRIEYRDATTAELNPLSDLVENISLMHGVHSDWPIRAD